MIRNHSLNTALGLAITAALAATSALGAATLTKADNADPLSGLSSWVTAIPTATDIALFDSTLTTPIATTLGAPTAWSGLQLINPAGDVTLSNDGNALTLGASGIDMSAATANLTINTPVKVASNQAWNIATTLTLNGGVSSDAPLRRNIAKQGPGTLLFSGSLAASNTMTIAAGTLKINSPTTFSNSTHLSAQSAGVIDLNGFSQTIGYLSTSSNIINSSPNPVALTLALDGFGFQHGMSGITQTNGQISLTLNEPGAFFGMTGASSYTGPTTVMAGQLQLNFKAAGPNIIDPQSPLIMAGGYLLVTNGSIANSQTFNTTSISAGHSSITLSASGPTSLDLGAISRSPGATLSLGVNSGSSASIYTSASLTPSGILGGWGNFGTNWATRDTASASSAITPVASYASTFGASLNTYTSNTLIQALPNAWTGSLRFGSGNVILSGINVIESGGILLTVPASVFISPTTLATDGITSGGSELIIMGPVDTGPLTINARITDNGAAPVGLTKSNYGGLTIGATATYTGPTVINIGTLVLAASQPNLHNISGSGSLQINANATATADTVILPVARVNGKLILRDHGPAAATASKVGSLALSGANNAWTSKVDLTSNTLIVQIPNTTTVASPQTIKAASLAVAINQLRSARAGGFWVGNGITSSVVAADNDPTHVGPTFSTTLALVDNADLHLTAYKGQSLDDLAYFITPALLGDADLSGAVDASDFDTWFSHVGVNSYSYALGDFDLSGLVDAVDFDIWIKHVGLNAFPVMPAAIPEPSTICLAAPLLLFLKRRASTRESGHRRL